MTGTIVNIIAIIAGSSLGLLLKKGVKESLMNSILKVEGVAVFVIGLNGVITTMISVGADGKLGDNGGMLLLLSLIFCIGSMGTTGALNDGLSGDSSLLLVKSVLDGVTSVVLASTMGSGVIFSAVPVFIYQGVISLFASSISPLLESCGNMMTQFNMVGSALIMCIGFNFITDSKIKTANLLPSLLVPILYNLLLMVEIF